MPIYRIAVGTPREASHPDALKAALAEFISMLIFVFAGEGSGMAFNKLTDNGSTTPAGLVAAALAHAFALFVAVSVGANISGGHVNPAVTFGAFLGGNITLLRGILYWIAQCLGSIVACLLLKFATGGLYLKTHMRMFGTLPNNVVFNFFNKLWLQIENLKQMLLQNNCILFISKSFQFNSFEMTRSCSIDLFRAWMTDSACNAVACRINLQNFINRVESLIGYVKPLQE